MIFLSTCDTHILQYEQILYYVYCIMNIVLCIMYIMYIMYMTYMVNMLGKSQVLYYIRVYIYIFDAFELYSNIQHAFIHV